MLLGLLYGIVGVFGLGYLFGTTAGKHLIKEKVGVGPFWKCIGPLVTLLIGILLVGLSYVFKIDWLHVSGMSICFGGQLSLLSVNIPKRKAFSWMLLLIAIGGSSNIIVICANGGKMPAFTNDPEEMGKIRTSFTHFVASERQEVHLPFLGDWIKGGESPGDVLIDTAGWISLIYYFYPFLLKHIKTKHIKTSSKILKGAF